MIAMILSEELKNKGFSLSTVSKNDFEDYLNVKRSCYKKYVDEYYGGWVEDFQIKMNGDSFRKTLKISCFQKILLDGSIVGFWGYDEMEDKINSTSIQLIEKAQNKGVGSFFLKELVSLSDRTNKPIFLRVFKSNPAQNLYKRFGFIIYDEIPSHFLMRYDPVA
ncbi:MAG: hypothetical protein PWQ77_2269 [Kosmotogales bacterium]|nr:hypothetical protein [Kosmotogales bacterium]